MKPVNFVGQTGVLKKPDGMTSDECGDLPYKQTSYLGKYNQYESVFELNDAELLTINLSRRIRLSVIGNGHPPVALQAEEFNAADGGVEMKPTPFEVLLEAAKNLENDDNSIPPHAWNLLQTAISNCGSTYKPLKDIPK